MPNDNILPFPDRLRDAMCHYHPDMNNKHDKEWRFLCGEIFKHVSNVRKSIEEDVS